MASIFLSYRRSDTAGHAGRLADTLRERFGPESVFQDVDAIPAGADFPRIIDEAVGRCPVFLALIGDTWATERSADGLRRLDDPRDFVRLEVGSALRRGAKVIPVPVEGARMPPEEEDLPPDLRPLARLQALELSDSRWRYDTRRLVEVIESIAGPGPGARWLSLRRPIRRTWVWGLLLAGVAAVAVGSYALRPGRADLSGRRQLPSGITGFSPARGARTASRSFAAIPGTSGRAAREPFRAGGSPSGSSSCGATSTGIAGRSRRRATGAPSRDKSPR